ncbi:MAG: YceI family protein [Anaerolineaceae bacterium]
MRTGRGDGIDRDWTTVVSERVTGTSPADLLALTSAGRTLGLPSFQESCVFLFTFLFGKLLGRIVSLAVVLLVVAGAGWYFFIREDNEAQKEAAPVTDAVRAAADASPTSATVAGAAPTAAPKATAGTSSLAEQSYSIIESQSLAWYLVPEKLASLPTSSVAKGTTSDVKGQFNFSASGLDSARPTTFTVGLKTLKSNESRRDDRAQTALETNKFPSATFTAKTLTGMPREFTAADSVMQMAGTLDLHGVKKDVVWELKVKKDGEILSGLGTVKFKFSDFGIKKPNVAGFVSVEDEVTLQIQLFAKPG